MSTPRHIAFNNCEFTHAFYQSRLEAAITEGRLTQGTGYNPSTRCGCFMGIVLQEYYSPTNPAQFAEATNLPAALGPLLDLTFESLPLRLGINFARNVFMLLHEDKVADTIITGILLKVIRHLMAEMEDNPPLWTQAVFLEKAYAGWHQSGHADIPESYKEELRIRLAKIEKIEATGTFAMDDVTRERALLHHLHQLAGLGLRQGFEIHTWVGNLLEDEIISAGTLAGFIIAEAINTPTYYPLAA